MTDKQRESMYMHHVRMQQVRNQRLSALRAMSEEERQAWFARVDTIFARTDAIQKQDWVLYLELGGERTPGLLELARHQRIKEDAERASNLDTYQSDYMADFIPSDAEDSPWYCYTDEYCELLLHWSETDMAEEDYS